MAHVSKLQWKPFWLADQLYPEWLAWLGGKVHVNYDVMTNKWDKNCLSNMARYKERNFCFRGSLTSTCYSVLMASAENRKTHFYWRLTTSAGCVKSLFVQVLDFLEKNVCHVFLACNRSFLQTISILPGLRLCKRVKSNMIITLPPLAVQIFYG